MHRAHFISCNLQNSPAHLWNPICRRNWNPKILSNIPSWVRLKVLKPEWELNQLTPQHMFCACWCCCFNQNMGLCIILSCVLTLTSLPLSIVIRTKCNRVVWWLNEHLSQSLAYKTQWYKYFLNINSTHPQSNPMTFGSSAFIFKE